MLKPMYNRVHKAQEAQEIIHIRINFDSSIGGRDCKAGAIIQVEKEVGEYFVSIGRADRCRMPREEK